jgi:hypothetical protein
VHSREAIDMVKEHVLAVLGPASMAFSNTMIKMSKLQAAQVYAASIMFGYFLRRVDTRFQLAQQLGVLPQSREDAVARLERLFAQVGASAAWCVLEGGPVGSGGARPALAMMRQAPGRAGGAGQGRARPEAGVALPCSFAPSAQLRPAHLRITAHTPVHAPPLSPCPPLLA